MSEDQPRSRRALLPGRHRRRGIARTALLWGLVGFVLLQAGLVAVVERWRPELRDPRYGRRLVLLRQRLAEAPGRPLVLFMGTSRTLNGVRPALLPAGPAVRFNFGQAMSGPIRQVLLLRRLLRAGIRPAHVYLEVLPAQLAFAGEADGLLEIRWVGLRDWPAFQHYWPATHSRRRWWREGLLPCVGCRDKLLGWLLPWAVPSWARPGPWDGSATEADGFFGYGDDLTGAALARWRATTRASQVPLLEDFRVHSAPDRALRHFLTPCRQQRIAVSLLLLPEGSACRSWYPPGALARLRDYLDGVQREFGIEVIDAREWVSDDGFSDSVHLLPRGATAFTRRFGDEVYRPLLRHWHPDFEGP